MNYLCRAFQDSSIKFSVDKCVKVSYCMFCSIFLAEVLILGVKSDIKFILGQLCPMECCLHCLTVYNVLPNNCSLQPQNLFLIRFCQMISYLRPQFSYVTLTEWIYFKKTIQESPIVLKQKKKLLAKSGTAKMASWT